MGVVEPVVSPWSSPIVLVRKKDGSIRFCVDLRRVNAETRKDAYPLPNITDCLSSLAGSQWYCTLDLASGYWQVAMNPRDMEKTAFATHRGQFAFRRMPFGLTNAPATFMRLMEMALRGLEWERCLVYLDDVIVFGENFDVCLRNLTEVLSRFETAGLKLKPSKCDLFQKEVAFLGHRVSVEGVRCDPAKLEAVRAWPEPANVTEVRSFLGLANYYKRFVPQFAAVALPLNNLLRKNVSFRWDEQCEESFQTLKTLLTTAPTLVYPLQDPEAEFILDTDASEYAIGAVLSQVQEGEERVVAYGSKALALSQRNYCTTYRELLAIVEFVPHFKHYLLGRRFRVRTDHSSLRWFLNFKDAEGLVGRWHAILANYDYKLEYREGAAHGNADAMSRHPAIQRRRRCGEKQCNECQGTEATPVRVSATWTNPSGRAFTYTHWKPQRAESGTVDEEDEWARPVDVRPVLEAGSNWLPTWSVEELRKWQEDDPTLAAVRKWVENNHHPNRKEVAVLGPLAANLVGLWATLELREGLLYRRWDTAAMGTTYQLVAPLRIRDEVFRQLHTVRQGGHFGLRRTVAVVRARFFWPGIKADVERWCRECQTCQRTKTKPKRLGLMQQEPAGGRFERVAIDIMGELPLTENGNRYILVISDYFTKWTQAFPIPNQTAAMVADTLMTNCFSLLGMPRWLHSDQGSNFESELFRELCSLLDVHKTRTVAYHPQSDGQVERFNRTCKQMLKAFVNENQTDWDDHLPLLLMAYRATPHESTGLSPNLMMFGEECTLPIDAMLDAPPRQGQRQVCRVEYVEWLRQTLAKGHRFARERLKEAAKAQKRYYDRAAKPHQFTAGAFVWHWYDPLAAKKFGCGWTGPYKVIACPTEVHCLIQKAPGTQSRRVHINKLKPHLGRMPPAWEDQPAGPNVPVPAPRRSIAGPRRPNPPPKTARVPKGVTDATLPPTQGLLPPTNRAFSSPNGPSGEVFPSASSGGPASPSVPSPSSPAATPVSPPEPDSSGPAPARPPEPERYRRRSGKRRVKPPDRLDL